MSKSYSFAVRANIWTLRLARHWLRVVLIILGIYISLPWVAPTLMKLGATDAGNFLYFLYSPFCHQFAFRSFFLYGEQAAYPRYTVGTGLTPFETYVEPLPEFAPDRIVEIFGIQSLVGDIYGFSPGFQGAAREFKGNEQMGYKMPLCERDITIYTAMFIGGVLYTRVRWRLRPAPWWLYIWLGLAPIGIDGFSQLLSYPPFNLWPVRETSPFFRVLTGALFGLMNVWLGFPYLERAMWDTRRQIESKLARIGIHI